MFGSTAAGETDTVNNPAPTIALLTTATDLLSGSHTITITFTINAGTKYTVVSTNHLTLQ